MTTIAKAGSLVSIDSGEYSDYSVRGFFVVLTDFDPKVEMQAFMAAQKENLNLKEWEREHLDTDRYLSHLLAKGLLWRLYT